MTSEYTERATRQDAAAPSGLPACPIDGKPATMLAGNCGHSWSAALEGATERPLPEVADTIGLREAAAFALSVMEDDGWSVRSDMRGLAAGQLSAALEGATERPLDLGDKIGRAMHEAAQVGGPWAPCPFPYNQWPDCEHQPMGQHVATIVLGIDNA
jgi:hypothetical protein